METLGHLANGFAIALTPINLMWAFVGVTLGTAIGVLPGLGPALTIALLLPLTYKVTATSAFILFAGIYYGAMYGGSTTSILLNTPGESATIVTSLEGNKMARKGRAGAALATAAIGSFIAGTHREGARDQVVARAAVIDRDRHEGRPARVGHGREGQRARRVRA